MTPEEYAEYLKRGEVGIVLGPPLVNAVPFEEALRFLGKVGVMLLVVESGLSVSVADIKAVGLRAFEASPSGMVESFVARFPAEDPELLALAEADWPHVLD